MPEPLLRYRWRYTHPEKGEDYLGYDEDFCFGRFFRAPSGAVAEMWRYGLQNIHHPGLRAEHMDGTAREVAAVIEALYERMLPLIDGVGMPAEREIAFFRRKGLPLPPGTAWRQARLVQRLSTEEADQIRREAEEMRASASNP